MYRNEIICWNLALPSFVAGVVLDHNKCDDGDTSID
jgi:hypothetical protein